MEVIKKSEGFSGQRSIVLPSAIIKEVSRKVFIRNLYVTDIGYYPGARFHFRERKKGCTQNIFIYCTSGEGWIIANKKKYLISKGDFVLIPSGTSHIYGANEGNPWTIYWLHISGNDAGFFFNDTQVVVKQLPVNDVRKNFRINLFEGIYQTLEMGYGIENLEYSSICLMHFLASFKYPGQFNQIQKSDYNDKVSKSIQYMRQHLSQRISLKDLAKFVELSTSHYSFIFRKKTYHPPMDYLIHLRIQKACQYLDNTTLLIKEIATSTGFDDPYYFSRIFKKIMGFSPLKYRKMEKG